MTSADVFEQIEKMGELPSLPQTLLKIQSVAKDDRSSADDLAKCILKDQALTMRILKVVNSAMYQRRNREKVRTVRRSVIVMGFETVRKLALGLSVFDMMSKLSRSPLLAEISSHSLLTAAIAQTLAEASGRVAPEEAFVTALIHDVGKIVLVECSPSAMDKAQSDMVDGVPVIEAERRHFGITHDRAGRRLAARWQLPSELQNVIGDHHDIDPLSPPKNVDPLLGTIVFANAMSRFTCQPADQPQEYRILRKAGKVLGISSHRLEEINAGLPEEINSLAECLGVDVGDMRDYGSVVNVEGSVNVAPRHMNPEEIANRTARQLDLYRKIGQGVSSGVSPNELLMEIMQGAVDILGFERVILLKVDRDAHLLRPLLAAGIDAEELAPKLELPLKRETGALVLAVLEHRDLHVPNASSEAYGDLAGPALLAAACCKGFAVSPVRTPSGFNAVLYGDCGPNGDDVVAEQATELAGLALQMGVVLSAGVGVEV